MITFEQANMLMNTAASCVMAGTGVWVAYENFKKSSGLDSTCVSHPNKKNIDLVAYRSAIQIQVVQV